MGGQSTRGKYQLKFWKELQDLSELAINISRDLEGKTRNELWLSIFPLLMWIGSLGLKNL